ncbi:hypothetical protein ACUH91_04730 [Dermabacteraceae bacterium P9123]
MGNETVENKAELSRRGLGKAAVWATPAVVMMGAAPNVCLSKNPFDDCQGPYFIDERLGGTPASGRPGNFHFIVPRGTEFPRLKWVVEIVPQKNNRNELKKGKRKFQIENLAADNAGSNASYSPPRENLNYDYDPSTGIQTATFETPAWEDNGRGRNGLNYGFKVFVGSSQLNAFDRDLYNRWDKLVVKAYQETSGGKTCKSLGPLVSFDSVKNAARGDNSRWQSDGIF